MKEGEVEEAALLPVLLGVGEDEVQRGHEENVGRDEDEEGVVVAGTEGIREQNKDEQPSYDLEQDGEEENAPENKSIIPFNLLLLTSLL